ncbi:MAG: methionyl-tRNA formyltransferase [Candidatus Paceibacterota bacterium]
MKFAFFGTPSVARDTLALLHSAGYTPAVVVTNPPAPAGRGQILTPSSTHTWAEEHKLPVLTPALLDTVAVNQIADHGCEYAIVVAYGKILPELLITAFPHGVYNIHYSLLPKYRGATPVETALLNGETETGVTIQHMVYELDAGDIVAQVTEPVLSEDTTTTLRARLITRGAELLVQTLPDIEAGAVSLTPQDHGAATYARKLAKADGELNLSAPAAENWNKYRAFTEGPGTFFFTERNGKQMRVKITDATRATDGTLKILKVIPEGKKEMAYEDFLQSRAPTDPTA